MSEKSTRLTYVLLDAGYLLNRILPAPYSFLTLLALSVSGLILSVSNFIKSAKSPD